MEEDGNVQVEETQEVEVVEPVIVRYCAVCGFPPEYCEFSPKFTKCAPWLLENYPDLYPGLKDMVADMDKASLEDSPESSNAEADDSKKGTTTTVTNTATGSSTTTSTSTSTSTSTPTPTSTSKKGKASKKIVLITRTQRNKRKHITHVSGLEHFGVKLSECARVFKKRFASGTTVTKLATGQEQIDIQGDVIYELPDFIIKKYKAVDKRAIFIKEDTKSPKYPAFDDEEEDEDDEE